MANALIGHNQRLSPKALQPYSANGAGTVYIVQHPSVKADVAAEAFALLTLLNDPEGSPGASILARFWYTRLPSANIREIEVSL
jgi:hypothetical protein